MDIKYIGSGEAARALVYYVTDYITKATLNKRRFYGQLSTYKILSKRWE
jgi:hypothetical protein